MQFKRTLFLCAVLPLPFALAWKRKCSEVQFSLANKPLNVCLYCVFTTTYKRSTCKLTFYIFVCFLNRKERLPSFTKKCVLNLDCATLGSQCPLRWLFCQPISTYMHTSRTNSHWCRLYSAWLLSYQLQIDLQGKVKTTKKDKEWLRNS